MKKILLTQRCKDAKAQDETNFSFASFAVLGLKLIPSPDFAKARQLKFESEP
jgi:hypothetical protein